MTGIGSACTGEGFAAKFTGDECGIMTSGAYTGSCSMIGLCRSGDCGARDAAGFDGTFPCACACACKHDNLSFDKYPEIPSA